MFKFAEKHMKKLRKKNFEKNIEKTDKNVKRFKENKKDSYTFVNKDNRRLVLLSKKVKFLLVLLFVIEIFSIVSLGLYNSGIFSKKLEVTLSSEKEIVQTGEIHKVTIRSAYSNPNDKGEETVRINIEDGNGVPNEKVKILNMENNMIEFPNTKKPFDNVVLQLIEEKDAENKIISRYLEYSLQPGSTVNMELEFIIDSGYNGMVETVELVPIINDDSIVQEVYLEDGITTEKVYKPIKLLWEADYKWKEFDVNTNYSAIGYDSRNGFSASEIEYTYSVVNENTSKEGLVYTKEVQMELETELPENFNFANEEMYSIDNNRILNVSGNTIYEVTVEEYDYEIENIEIIKGENERYTIKSKIKIINPEETENLFNPIDKIKTKLNLNNLPVSSYSYDGKVIIHKAKFIANSVILGVSWEESNSIENGFSANGELTINKSVLAVLDTRGDYSNETEYYSAARKSINVVRPEYQILYRINVNNANFYVRSGTVYDYLPEDYDFNSYTVKVYQTVNGKKAMLTQNVDYGQSLSGNTLYFYLYNIPANGSVSIEYMMEVNRNRYEPNKYVSNRASINGKSSTEYVKNIGTGSPELKYEIVSRRTTTIVGSPVFYYKDAYGNYYCNGDYNAVHGCYPSPAEIEEAMKEFNAGDKIEYLVTLDNRSPDYLTGTLGVDQPFGYWKKSGYWDYYTKNYKYYSVGEDFYIYGYGTNYDSSSIYSLKNGALYQYDDLSKHRIKSNCEPFDNCKSCIYSFYNNGSNYNSFIEPFTMYKQSLILQIPGDNTVSLENSANEDFLKFKASASSDSLNNNYYGLKTRAYWNQSTPYTTSYASTEYTHYASRSVYMNSGCLGHGIRESSDNYTIKVKQYFRGYKIEKTDILGNPHYFYDKENETLVNWVYLYNDSSKDMDLSNYEISIYMPSGFTWEGFVDEGGYKYVSGNFNSNDTSTSYINEGNYLCFSSPSSSTYTKDSQGNCVRDGDTRTSSPMPFSYSKPSPYTSKRERVWINSSNYGNYVSVTSSYTISKFSGIMFTYAVKVNNPGSMPEYGTFVTNLRKKSGYAYEYNQSSYRYSSRYMEQVSPFITAHDYDAQPYGSGQFKVDVENAGNCSSYKTGNLDTIKNPSGGIDQGPYCVWSYVNVARYTEKVYANVTKKVYKNSGDDGGSDSHIDGRQYTIDNKADGYYYGYDNYNKQYILDDGIHRTVDGTVTYVMDIQNSGYSNWLSNVNYTPVPYSIDHAKNIRWGDIIETIDSPYWLKEIWIPVCYFNNVEKGAGDYKYFSNLYIELPEMDGKPVKTDELSVARVDEFIDKAIDIGWSASYNGSGIVLIKTFENSFVVKITIKNVENGSLGYGYDVENGDQNKNAICYRIEFSNYLNDPRYQPVLLPNNSGPNNVQMYFTFSTTDSIETNYNTFDLVLNGINSSNNIITTGKAITRNLYSLRNGKNNINYDWLPSDTMVIEYSDWTDTSYTDGQKILNIYDDEGTLVKKLDSRNSDSTQVSINHEASGMPVKSRLMVESVLYESENYTDFHNLQIYDVFGYPNTGGLYDVDFESITVRDKLANNDKNIDDEDFASSHEFVLGRDYEIWYTTELLGSSEHHPISPVNTLNYAVDLNKIESEGTEWIKYDPINGNNGDGANAFKIVLLGDRATVKNGRLSGEEEWVTYEIYVDFDATIRSNLKRNAYYNAELAWTADVQDSDENNTIKHIKEDTTGLTFRATTNYKAYLSKVVNDIEGNDITNKIDKEFTYLVLKTGVYYYNYKYELKSSDILGIAKVKIKPGENIELTNSEDSRVQVIYNKYDEEDNSSRTFFQSDPYSYYYIIELDENSFENSGIQSIKDTYLGQEFDNLTLNIGEIETSDPEINNILQSYDETKISKGTAFYMGYNSAVEINIIGTNIYKPKDVILQKTDMNRNTIWNRGKFKLYDSNDNIVKFHVDEKGWYHYSSKEETEKQEDINMSGIAVLCNLLPGEYTLKEEQAPYGFKEGEDIHFTVRYDSSNINITIPNERDTNLNVSKLKIYKIDYDTGEKITSSSARFKLFEKDNLDAPLLLAKDADGVYTANLENEENMVDEVETVDGEIKVYNLTLGEYVLVETDAPNGYVDDNNKYEFELTNENYIEFYEMYVRNEKARDLKLKKTDSKGTGIEGAKFEITDYKNEKVKFNYDEEGKVYVYSSDGDVTQIASSEIGEIYLKQLPVGKYVIKELEQLETYTLMEDKEIELVAGNNAQEETLINLHNFGDMYIEKHNIDGELIDSNIVGFKVYDENGKELRFSRMSTEELENLDINEVLLPEDDAENDGESNNNDSENSEGEETDNIDSNDSTDLEENDESEENENTKEIQESVKGLYKYDANGGTTIVKAKNGKIGIINIPTGKYYLEEVVAPKGYSLLKDKKEFVIADENYFEPAKIVFTNVDYLFGQQGHVSASYQKIVEKDNINNYGYSYYGKKEDYLAGNKNYVVVDDKKDTVTYTLKMRNMSNENFEKLVLIDKLPAKEDVGVVNIEENRDSEFEVKLANNPEMKVFLLDPRDSEEELIYGEDYTIQYTDEKFFTNDDWDGKDDEKWYDEKKESTNSYRIVFAKDYILPIAYTIKVSFDGKIEDNAVPGQIAWNSFAYRYYVGETSLTAEPPKVGVKVPISPKLTKESTIETDDVFKFDIIEKTTNNVVGTVSTKSGQTVEIPIKRTINGETSGFVESGKTYLVKEQGDRKNKVILVEGTNGNAEGTYFEFTYDSEVETTMKFTNSPLEEAEIELNKFDSNNRETLLKGAKFKVFNENEEELKFRLRDGKYYIESEGTNIVETNISGKIVLTKLPFGTYDFIEVEPPKGYSLSTQKYTVVIDENSYEVENYTNINIPKKVDIENKINVVSIEKLYQESLIKGAQLIIINEETGETVKEFITEGEEKDIYGLEKGKYILREVAAPEKFYLANDIQFEITAEGKIIVDDNEVEKIKMYDKPILGTIKLTKTGEKLFETNDVKELQNEENKDDEDTVVDEELGIDEETTIDGESNNELDLSEETTEERMFSYEEVPLKGVKFKLFAAEEIKLLDEVVYKENDFVAENVTDEEGTLEFNDIIMGNYYLIEDEAPAGFEKNEEPIEVTIEKNSENEEINVDLNVFNERIKAEIEILKNEAGSEKALSGAIFALYTNEEIAGLPKDTLLEEVTTNESGIAKFSVDIPLGEYYVKEIKAPIGYQINQKIEYITLGKQKVFNLKYEDWKEGTNEFIIKQESTDDGIPKSVTEGITGDGKVAKSVPFTGDNIMKVVLVMGIIIGVNIAITVVLKLKRRYKRMK